MAKSAGTVLTAVPVTIPSLIPLDSIENLRLSFPGQVLIFEIDLVVQDCWSGLEHLAAACRRAGVELKFLRCNAAGAISCSLVDGGGDGGGDLAELAQKLTPLYGVTVTGWTTRIHYA